ncbi:hypothetical protein Bra471DRAFT_01587 [Bradyrhizobium sp. WSM471]|nr:hypothetical protein Bra471DRAFT_01587 [Bradyrhizobium sp. WSM471]
MKVLDTWAPYSDLAMLLEQDASRFSITTYFVLNQLHAFIRVPFELLSDQKASRCGLVRLRARHSKYGVAQLPLGFLKIQAGAFSDHLARHFLDR